jgi:8-oxo-dGTP pyrophosphatase MutT (NUDIX family)
MTSRDGTSVEHLRETPVARREIHRGRLLHVVDDEVRLADGTIAHREVVLHPGAVAVVALHAEGRAVLVRQWRHAAGQALWEIPAGTRDHAGEEPEQTAKRELQEETGFRAASWQRLGGGFLCPGYSTEEMRFFLASDLTEGEPSTDADERLDVGTFGPAEIAELIRTGQVDVKTIAGLALAGWKVQSDG